MDQIGLKEQDFALDLECGRNTGEEEGLIKFEDPVSSGFDTVANVKVEIDKKVEGEENLDFVGKKEKRKKTSNKKAPKPPRPPRGPSLDASDQKLIREIAELAMLKRARTERMKALKKVKASKASSSSANLVAMALTIIFCFVILIQGISSRASSPLSFSPSPESSEETQDSFSAVNFFQNASVNGSSGLDSGSSSAAQPASGLVSSEKLSRIVQ